MTQHGDGLRFGQVASQFYFVSADSLVLKLGNLRSVKYVTPTHNHKNSAHNKQ
jgi:hypothetical protein